MELENILSEVNQTKKEMCILTVLVIKYRIPMIYPIFPKKLNMKKVPRENF